MSRTWVNGSPPFLNAANLNALEADITTALGVPDVALAGRITDPASATQAALNATYALISAVPPTTLDGGNATSVYTGTFNFDGGSAT